MLAFAIAVFLLLITPGPGVLSAAGVGAAYGKASGVRYIAGLFLGTNLVALAVVFGLASVILTVPSIRNVFLVASAAYLVLLAWRIAFAGSRIAFIHKDNDPGIVAGILLQIINPKAYAVNTTLFTGFAFAPDSLLFETVAKFIIINSIWIPIHLLWLWAGISIQKLNLKPVVQSRINVFMAIAMLGVVLLAGLSII